MHGVGQDNRLYALLCSLLIIVDDTLNWCAKRCASELCSKTAVVLAKFFSLYCLKYIFIFMTNVCFFTSRYFLNINFDLNFFVIINNNTCYFMRVSKSYKKITPICLKHRINTQVFNIIIILPHNI